MKTSELKLGNYVMRNDSIVCVNSVHEVSVGYKYLNKDAIGISYIEAISPILLTEEFLLKLGAGKYTDDIDKIYYKIDGNQEPIYILHKEGVYYYAYETVGIVYKTIPCTGLHSLQNKYYALNGVEMEVKL